MSERTLGRLFWQIEAKTDKLKPQLQQARQEIAKTVGQPVQVPVTANTKPAEQQVEKFKTETKKSTTGSSGKSALEIEVRANVRQAQAQVESLKRVMKEAKLDPANAGTSPAVIARIDADISRAEAKVARLKEALKSVGGSDELGLKNLNAGANGIKATVERITDGIDGAFSESNAKKIRAMTVELRRFAEATEGTGLLIARPLRTIAAAISSPLVAGGLLSAAFIGIGAAATKMAADFDTAVRKIQSQLPAGTADIEALKDGILALSQETPRSAEDLAKVAQSLTKIGDADPATIAADMRALAFTADALGMADLSPLVGMLGKLRDAYGLSNTEARNAVVQIGALARGKIDIEELAGIVGDLSTKMNNLNVSATQTAQAVSTLAANGAKKDVRDGLGDVLDMAAGARRQATAASADGRDGDARALSILAETMSKAKIEANGLIPQLADLYEKLGRSKERFQQAGLGVAAFNTAQAAATAVAKGFSSETKTNAEYIKEMKEAADLNRESASALGKVIKNELVAELIALGNTALPPVLAAMRGLLYLLSETRRAVKNTGDETEIAAKQFAKIGDARARADGFRRSMNSARTIVGTPNVLKSDELGDPETLRTIQKNLALTINAVGNKALEGFDQQVLQKALAITSKALAEAEGIGDKSGQKVGGSGSGAAPFANSADGKAARDAIKDARQAYLDLLSSFGETGPYDQAEQAIAQWTEKAREAKVDAKEVAANLVLLRGALDDKKARDAANALAGLNVELARLSGDTIGLVVAEYDKLIRAEEEQLRLTDRSTAQGQAVASAQERKITLLRQQKAAMTDLTALQKTFEASTRQAAAAEAMIASSRVAGAQGMLLQAAGAAVLVKTQADLKTQEAQLRDQIAKTKDGTDERKKAEEQLNAVLREQERIKKGQTATATPSPKSMADEAIRLGNGLRNAAQAGLALAQALGKGGSALAQMLAGATSLGSGIASIGDAAKKAPGGNPFSSWSGIASLLPGFGQALGGIISIGGALGIGKKNPEVERQLQVQKQNTDAIELLTTRIGDLAELGVSGSLFGKIDDAVSQLIESLAFDVTQQTAEGDVVTRGTAAPGQKVDAASFFARLGLSMDEVEKLAKGLGITLDGTAGSFYKLRDAIARADFALFTKNLSGVTERLQIMSLIAGTSTDPLTQLTNKFRTLPTLAPELAKLFDLSDLSSPEGIARLRGQVADLLNKALTLDPNSPEAEAFFRSLGDLKPDEFLSLFKEILEGLDEFKSGLEQFVSAFDVFNAQAKVFGIEGADYVRGLVTVFGNQFSQLQGILDGVDLSTAAGVEKLKERLRALFTTLLEGGVTLEEGKIIDAITQIIGALGSLPEALDPLASAIGAATEKFDIFGTKARDQFNELGALFKAQFPFGGSAGLGEVLGDTFQQDIDTEEGRASLKARIGAAISAILADGVVSEAERPLLDALKQLFGLVNETIADAANDAQKAADEAERNRQASLAGRARDARTSIELNDLSGSDAFLASLGGYSEQLQGFFGLFDTASLGGIEDAKEKVRAIYGSLADMTDAEIVERFGMTRDEVISALTDVDAGLDGLAQGLKDLAQRQGDFLNDLNVQFLDATGQGLEAVKLQTRLWVEQMIATAKALGVYSEEIDKQIRTIGQSRIDAAADRAAGSAADSRDAVLAGRSARAAALTVADAAKTIDGEITAQRVQSITAAQALDLADIMNSSLVEHRAIRAAVEMMASLMSGMAGLALGAPLLPPSTFTSGGSGGSTIQIVVNVNGPIVGQTAREAGVMLAEATMPYLNEALARAAGVEARLSGVPLA